MGLFDQRMSSMKVHTHAYIKLYDKGEPHTNILYDRNTYAVPKENKSNAIRFVNASNFENEEVHMQAMTPG